jgi:hypothetical protein
MHVLRKALAMADAEMAGLMTAEPSPELAVRIRQAVADSEPSLAWRFGWLWPATAAAATLLVALAVALGRNTGPTPQPRVLVDARRPPSAGSTRATEAVGEPVGPVARPVPDADQQPVPQGSRSSSRGATVESGDEGSAGLGDLSAPDSRSAPARSHSAGRQRIPAEPEVLVPPGETEALLRFVALVHREHLTPTSLAAAGEPSTDLAELALIDIKPLEIVPLDPAETSGT